MQRQRDANAAKRLAEQNDNTQKQNNENDGNAVNDATEVLNKETASGTNLNINKLTLTDFDAEQTLVTKLGIQSTKQLSASDLIKLFIACVTLKAGGKPKAA